MARSSFTVIGEFGLICSASFTAAAASPRMAARHCSSVDVIRFTVLLTRACNSSSNSSAGVERQRANSLGQSSLSGETARCASDDAEFASRDLLITALTYLADAASRVLWRFEEEIGAIQTSDSPLATPGHAMARRATLRLAPSYLVDTSSTTNFPYLGRQSPIPNDPATRKYSTTSSRFSIVVRNVAVTRALQRGKRGRVRTVIESPRILTIARSRKSLSFHIAPSVDGPSCSRIAGASTANAARAMRPLLRVLAPSIKAASRASGVRQGLPSCSQRDPCHSSSAIRLKSATVFIRLLVTAASC